MSHWPGVRSSVSRYVVLVEPAGDTPKMPTPSLPQPPRAPTESTTVEIGLRPVAEVTDPPRLSPFPAGTRLGQGRFVVGEMIGRGGMGAVYDVRDGQRGADLALKLLLDARPERLLAFKNEFRALQDLRHPNLVRLDELFVEDDRWFFTMERVAGIPFVDYARAALGSTSRAPARRPPAARARASARCTTRTWSIATSSRPTRWSRRTGGSSCSTSGWSATPRSPHDVLLPGAGTVAYMAPEQVRGAAGGPPTGTASA